MSDKAVRKAPAAVWIILGILPAISLGLVLIRVLMGVTG